jgi:hypothetical protein
MSSSKISPLAIFLAALCWCGPVSNAAKADVVFSATGTGSGGSGPLAATLDFKAVNGGLEVTVTNALPSTDTINRGEAISALSFSVSGLNTPTSFSEFSGNKVDSSTFTSGSTFPGTSPVTAFDDTSATNVIDHWRLATSGSSVVLATAGSTAPPMNPIYMILPSSGITGPGASLSNGHFDPYVLGSANFFLADAGITANTVLTAADFTGVTVGFGTTPDTTLSAHVAPEPASLTLLGISCVIGAIGLRRRQRRTQASSRAESL